MWKKKKETQSLHSDWLRIGCVILGFYDLFVSRNLMPRKVFSGTNIETFAKLYHKLVIRRKETEICMYVFTAVIGLHLP